MNDKDHEIVCQQYEALLKKLESENAELKARWEKLRDIDDKEFAEVFHGTGMKRHCAQMMRI